MAVDSFLPEGYVAPSVASSYTKFEEDKTTRIRILSSPILGWEYWDKTGEKNTPKRLAYTPENYQLAVRSALFNREEKDQKVKHFWAFVVWNYETKQIEICEVTQASIQKAIRTLCEDVDYGSPVNKYDLKITRKKEKDITSYTVLAGKESATTDEIVFALEEKPVRLEALYDGEDPFATQ